ncbi:MAG: c-type cytochrome [Chitinophagaceae bacterium]
MKSKQLILYGGAGIFLLFFYVYELPTDKIKNNTPKVKILTPVNAVTFNWDSFISYSIRVTDVEDGSSDYGEIPLKEVFLEVTWLPGNSKPNESNLIKTGLVRDPPGLALMKSSTCFNCHLVKAKLTGPSFLEISSKYPYNSATITMLAKKVIKGSTGVWSNTAMPANPDFTEVQSKQMIEWIFKNADNPNRNYYVGTEGAFKTRGRPDIAKGSYILTASYTDHGLKGVSKSNQRGQHTIVIHSK